MNKINEIYYELLGMYSNQGWWPIISYDGINSTKTGSVKGYHPNDYSFPRNDDEKFEIIIGAVLTQNTTWIQVEKSLINLSKYIEFNPRSLLDFSYESENDFKLDIKPSGYFNQKFKYLQNISEFILNLDGKTPSRDELLSVKGIGPETCDSILLYAYSKKEFVVDAYTKRIFSYLGFINLEDGYDNVKRLFEDNFDGDVYQYQEYHALIVEHAKNYYSKKPYDIKDNILDKFKNK